MDYDDEEIKALFTDVEWEELTKDRIGIPSISLDIAKELAKYDKNTLEDLRATVMTSYFKDGEKYDAHKHHDQEWIQLATRILVDLYENVDSPLTRTQYENWFTVALFGTCIDFFIRDHQLGTDIKRLIRINNKIIVNFRFFNMAYL